MIDPFLFLNHHGPQNYQPGNNGLPFGPHPHRGMETVTFILDGDIAHKDSGGNNSVIESGDYKRFYMHRTGHWLGMDVHDVGNYKLDNNWRDLLPGMALTVEPGLYIRPADNVPEALWNIGIRIEDDIVITEQGCEVLTHAVPKTVSEIEDLMKQHD